MYTDYIHPCDAYMDRKQIDKTIFIPGNCPSSKNSKV